MSENDKGLERLKKKMTPQQRKDMAELLANELRSREAAKVRKAKAERGSNVKSSRMATGLDREQARAMYAEMQQALKTGSKPKKSGFGALSDALRSGKKSAASDVSFSLSPEAAAAQQMQLQMQSRNTERSGLTGKHVMLMSGIVVVAILKVLSSTGVVNASVAPKSDSRFENTIAALPAAEAPAIQNTSEARAIGIDSIIQQGGWTAGERKVLLELDERRVELERRREALERREDDLNKREAEISARVAEMRSLTRTLKEHRQTKDNQYESRMEQLANVYGSMPPQEAAPLIAKLDESIALELLQRLPGKRMGQVLSMMNQDRAIDLTRLLTDRKQMK